jgi:hypothetical protein
MPPLAGVRGVALLVAMFVRVGCGTGGASRPTPVAAPSPGDGERVPDRANLIGGLALQQAAGTSGVQLDMGQMHYLGTSGTGTFVLFVNRAMAGSAARKIS